MDKEEKMIDLKCSVCNKNMQMPMSFLDEIPNKDANNIPHICSDCTNKLGETMGNEKMQAFIDDVNKQMDKLGKNNETAEKIAEELTNENIDSLIEELKEADVSREELMRESFFRGAWISLFLIANNHESGFLEKESKGIRDFHNKTKKY